MIGATVSNNRILEKLGQSGIGVVRKVEDREADLAAKPWGIPSVFVAIPRPNGDLQSTLFLNPFNTLLTQALLTPT